MAWLPVLMERHLVAEWFPASKLQEMSVWGGVFGRGVSQEERVPWETWHHWVCVELCCHTSCSKIEPSIHSLGQKIVPKWVCWGNGALLGASNVGFHSKLPTAPVSPIPALSHFSSEGIQRVMINLILVSPFLNKILGKKQKGFLPLGCKRSSSALGSRGPGGAERWLIPAILQDKIWLKRRAAALKPGSGI